MKKYYNEWIDTGIDKVKKLFENGTIDCLTAVAIIRPLRRTGLKEAIEEVRTWKTI